MIIRILLLLSSFVFLYTSSSQASVVMQGNRVVFNASSESQTINFKNSDNFPYVVQIWTSVDKDGKATDKNNGPFILSPTVFKIPPHESQVVRMIYSNIGDKLDSEKLYYLHFIQVPAVPSELQGKNKLLLVINSTVKVFIRPDNLSVSHDDMFKFITYSMSETSSRCHYLINNKSPYILNSIEYNTSGNATSGWNKMDMIAPGGSSDFVAACKASGNRSPLMLKVVNDYGVINNVNINRSE